MDAGPRNWSGSPLTPWQQARYRDVAEVVAAGVRLLQRAEVEVAEFVASLEAARAEGERDGFVTIDELAAELDAIIAEGTRGRA